MDILIFLIPITVFVSVIGLIGFIWCLKSKQYEDLKGSSSRILFDDKDE